MQLVPTQPNRFAQASAFQARPPASATGVQKAAPVKFGLAHGFCGICPICLGGAAVFKELDNLDEMRNDVQELGEVEVEIGQGSANIRREGMDERGGGDTRTRSIGNEDGSRLQPVETEPKHRGILGGSESDRSKLEMAALPRAYKSSTYSIKEELDDGIFKLVMGGIQKRPQTFVQGVDEPPPPIERKKAADDELFNNAGPGEIKKPASRLLTYFRKEQKYKTFVLYHHLAEHPEARRLKRSLPIPVAYTTFTDIKPGKEIFAASLREMPRFENMGAEAGALMNLMAGAMQNGYESVAVALEPWQQAKMTDLKDYIEQDLQAKYGYPVEKLDYRNLPRAYREEFDRIPLPQGTVLYRIDLKPLQEHYRALQRELGNPYWNPKDAAYTTHKQGQLDFELLENIKMEDVIRGEIKRALDGFQKRMMPQWSEVTLFGKTIHLPGLVDFNPETGEPYGKKADDATTKGGQ